MPKKARVETKVQSFTCSNPKCRRTFASPIIVQDLCSSDEVSYDACPYCLTEIVTRETMKTKSDEKDEKSESQTKESEEAKYKKLSQPAQPSEGPAECLYHFGYLSERSRDEEIPEVCMTCERLVQCMFKKVV